MVDQKLSYRKIEDKYGISKSTAQRRLSAAGLSTDNVKPEDLPKILNALGVPQQQQTTPPAQPSAIAHVSAQPTVTQTTEVSAEEFREMVAKRQGEVIDEKFQVIIDRQTQFESRVGQAINTQNAVVNQFLNKSSHRDTNPVMMASAQNNEDYQKSQQSIWKDLANPKYWLHYGLIAIGGWMIITFVWNVIFNPHGYQRQNQTEIRY